MRKQLLLVAIVLSIVACKTKRMTEATVAATPKVEMKEQDLEAPKTTGKVSHQYKATGCATVVIIKIEGEENPGILIPSTKLPDGLDVDGKEIMFDYRTLKMPNPPGCTVGIPAELTNIKSK